MSNEIVNVLIKELRPSATNPRKKVDASKIEELADSIKCFGILTPVLVRPCEDRGPHEIVNGHRRVEAAKQAGLEEVPCIIRALTDEEALEIQLVDNIQRADIDPLDEAECFRQMVNQLKLQPKVIAARLGKPAWYVAQRMKLVDLTLDWRDLYNSGVATIGVVLLVCRQTEADQAALLKELQYQIRENFLTVDETKRAIERKFHLELSRAAFPKKDPLLVPDAGSCEECPKRTGFNKELFNDVGKADRCTDSACFIQKADLFLRVQEEKQKDLQRLSILDKWGQRARIEGKPIPANLYTLATKDHKGKVEKGLLIDGLSRGKVLDFIYTGESPESADHAKQVKERQKKQSEKEKAQFDFRDRVEQKLIEALIEGAPTEFDLKDLREFCEWLYDSTFHQNVYPVDDVPVFKKASAGDLIKFLLGFWAVDVTETGGDEATEIAKRWGINVKGIQEAVRKEMEAEATEASKKKESKPAKKAGKH